MKPPIEFRRLYNTRLLPALQQLEPVRKDALGSFWLASMLLAGSLPCFLVFFRSGKWAGLIAALLLLAAGVYRYYVYQRKRTSYAVHFKELVIREIILLIDPNLVYRPSQKITEYEYRESDIFRNPIDSYSGDDLVEGVLGATYFRFSELCHKEKKESVDSRGRRRTHWVTVFKGVFFIADFNKHFHGRTYVVPDAGMTFLGLGKLFEQWSFNRGERVELENPEFEQLFTVYGTDPVEARYILSTSLMERLVDFRHKADTRLHLSFINSKLFLAISLNKNLFEPNLFSSGLKYGYLKDYFRYLDLVTGIIEDLNLNLRIWGKS